MRLGKYLSSLTKPELEELRNSLNLTYSEEKVFNILSKGASKTSVANACFISERTVDNRIKAIRDKIYRLRG